MKSDQVTLSDLGGGLNRSVAPTAIELNECSELENWDVIERKLSRRGGIVRRLTRPHDGMQRYQTTAASVHGLGFFDTGILLLGEYDRFQKQSGYGVVTIPGDPVTAGTAPWSMAGNNGAMWAGRPGGRLWRITESRASVAGVNPPATAPTPASGGAGLVTLGTYQYFVTFQTSLGDESSPSPVTTIALAVDSIVSLTAIPNSSQAHVTNKRIWRTLPNDAGQAWLVASIGATATTYSDNTPNAELGEPFGYENGLPPTEAYSVAKWNERLWVHDRQQLYGSRVGLFETFSEVFDSFDARGGREIRGLHGWDTRLMVGTTEKIFQVIESGVDSAGVRFDVTQFCSDHGVASHSSMQSAEGILFWADRDGVYASPGGAPSCVSTPKIRDIIKAADPESLQFSCGYIDPARTEYALSIGRPADSMGNRLLDVQIIYNWRRGTWTTRRFTDDSIQAVPYRCAPVAAAQRNDVTYCSFGGYNVSQMDTGNKDSGFEGHRITARARFKSFGEPQSRTALRKVHLDVTSANEEITLRIYQDGRALPVRVNTTRLNVLPDRNLKRIGLGRIDPGFTPLCAEFQAEVEYSGETPIDLNEIHFERDLFGIQGRSQ